MQWSTEGQTPEFLAATRMASLNERNVRSMLELLDLEDGANVLDAGCGSGEYAFRLGTRTSGIHFTGFDNDEEFVNFATMRANGAIGYPFEEPNPANSYQFVCADASKLPFDNTSFNAVVSHTYLTAVPDWQSALSEMIRVCKPGGTVSSVTSMTNDFYGTGYVSLFKVPFTPDDEDLAGRIWQARALAFSSVSLTAGIAPAAVPGAFANAGLEDICCVPLGHYFCLSDARLSEQDYRRYVELVFLYELKEFERLKAAPCSLDVLGRDGLERYEHLLYERRQELLDSYGCNHEWNWYGNSSLFVCGTVAK